MSFFDWLFWLLLAFALTWALAELINLVDDFTASRWPRACKLCRHERRRPGDVLCWGCTLVMRRAPQDVHRG